MLKVLLDLVLVSGVGVDCVPAKHRVGPRPLENCLNQLGEDRVQQAQVPARDQYEAEHHACESDQSLAVRPLDALELGPDCNQELYDTRALLVRLVRLAPATTPDGVARLTGPVPDDVVLGEVLGGLPVLDLLERLLLGGGWRRVALVEQALLVLEHEVASALLLRRSAHGEVGIDGRTAQIGWRIRTLLLQPARAALGLSLLGALAVTRHGSARLLVRRVLAAPAAVLAKLNPVRVVPLRLLGLVVTPLALLACEGHGDSNVSASHGSFGR